MKGFLKSLPHFLFTLLLTHTASGQLFFKNASIGIGGHYGSFLTTAPKAQYVKDSYTYFGEAYFQKQSSENRNWGAGAFFGNTGSRQYIGNMGGAFAFVLVPLLQKQKLESSLRIGTGLGWVQKPYDKITNHKNVIIGSHLNSYINFTWQNELQIFKTLYVNAGISFNHLSNAGTKMPNMGLNIPALIVGVRYGGEENKKQNFQPHSFSKKVSLSVYTSAGIKQFPWVESKRYLVNIVQAEAQKHFNNSNQIGGGVVFFYDRSNTVDPSGDPSVKRKGNYLMAGVYASYEYSMGSLSIPLQLGAYVYNQDIYKTLFQQLGLRYQCSNKLSAQVLLKTHMGKADVLHAGIGYHFN